MARRMSEEADIDGHARNVANDPKRTRATPGIEVLRWLLGVAQ